MLKKTILSGFVATSAILALSPASAVEAVSTEFVNMRTAPGVHSAKVAVIPSGASLDIKHCLATRPWCEVSYGNNRGWTAARYIDTQNPHSIPVIYGSKAPVVKKVRYETVTTPVIQSENVVYAPAKTHTYVRSVKPGSVIAPGSTIAPGSAVRPSNNSLANSYRHVVSAPAGEFSTMNRGMSSSQYVITKKNVSYPIGGHAKKIIVERDLPPVYIKERDLIRNNARNVSYEAIPMRTIRVVNPAQKTTYVVHPTEKHVVAQEPQAKRVAYIEKVPVQHVRYERPVWSAQQVAYKPQSSRDYSRSYVTYERSAPAKYYSGEYKAPKTVSREVVVEPKRNVKKVSYKNSNRPTVEHVKYRSASRTDIEKKPEVRKVIYKRTITTTTAPRGLHNVSSKKDAFVNTGLENVRYTSKRINEYNPAQPTSNIHNQEFHRNETRYQKVAR